MYFKTIIQGKLEFGNEKSYNKVFKMFQHRLENYYKSDTLLKDMELFDEESFTLNLPRLIVQVTEKNWRNTINLLEYVAQFASSGSIGAWMLETGKILRYGLIEPQSDKAAVQEFIKGRKLSKIEGKEKEAIDSLSKAIERHDRHAQAYEKRGFVNLQLKNYFDAEYDFSKSLRIDPGIPESYFGRALIKMHEKKYKEAVTDLDLAIKNSIALQFIYWESRRTKAKCHIKLKEYKEAAFDLKLFTNRKFTEDNPNLLWKREAFYEYGKVLLELEDYDGAISAFDSALNLENGKDKIHKREFYFFRGVARKKAGKSGFLKDWKTAAGLGSKRAATMIKERSK